ncbi:MAG: hypothetical protein IJ196_08295 [Prevotella sp.]|nr:hypothetical protein [Prevotella sp.]
MENAMMAEKARNYLVCYLEECPLQGRCLRYMAGKYVPEEAISTTCVSRNHALTGTESCPLYRSSERLEMKWGMTRFYEEMPRRVAVAVKRELEERLGHTMYYRYRDGLRPVTPRMQRDVERVCRRHGWTKAPVYDRSSADYDW